MRYLGSVRQWHWVSAAFCLVAMLLFAITGITLNHAASIPATPKITIVDETLPAELLTETLTALRAHPQIPQALRQWLWQTHRIHIGAGRVGEWQDEEFYLPLPAPGADGWLTLDSDSGQLYYEFTDRGWIAYFNDLHKGRHTGEAWRWFIDFFALLCVVFCGSGLWLLMRQAKLRRTTWPLVAAGFVLPCILLLLLSH